MTPVRITHRLAAAAALLFAAHAHAASLLVIAVDRDGKPLADAVITVHVPGATARPPAKPLAVVQEDFAFKPFVTVVAAGTPMLFPNRDRVAHHLRATSNEYAFEFPIYEPGRTPAAVTLDKVGTIQLNCLIHTSMRAYVRVVDTPFAAVTDEHGTARFDGVPDGTFEVRGWHPDLILQAPRIEVRFGATPANVQMKFPLAPQPRPQPRPRRPAADPYEQRVPS